jgi:transcriptional regulator with XRE-family HTH domain
MEILGKYIHKLRKKHGLTLTKLAAALDIDQSTLSKIENQKRTVPEELVPRLAKVFKLDVEELKREYYSEKIAELIYQAPDAKELLIMAEDKIKYYRASKVNQGNLKFK